MRKLGVFIGEEFAKFYNSNKSDTEGVFVRARKDCGIRVMEVTIEAQNALNRKQGNYFTLDLPDFSEKAKERMIKSLTNVIKQLLPSSADRVLVLGMGNAEIISDTLGVKAIEKLDVLEFLRCDNYGGRRKRVAKFAPGVVSVTGIESFDLCRAVVDIFSPDAVIVVDSLCTKTKTRLGTSFQVSDAGIVPGSAEGNMVCDLSSESLGGVAVISVGVPVVIDIGDLLYEEIKKIEPAEELQRALKQKINEFDGIFSPKDIDLLINFTSEIVSRAILLAIK